MRQAKAYAVKVEMPDTFFGSLRAVEKISSIIGIADNTDLVGVHQRPEGSYLLFATTDAARMWSRKLKANGIAACNITQPCYYYPDQIGHRTEIVPPTLKRDFEDFQKMQETEAKASVYEREKAELKRQLGDALANVKANNAVIKAKKEQISELVDRYEKALAEKNARIGWLERRVKELENELKEREKEHD